MYCLCRYVLRNRTSPKTDQYFYFWVWYWVPSICLILINTSVICLDQGPFGERNYLASKTTWVDTCSLNSTLKYFPTSGRIFQIHSFLLILFLGIWRKLRSGYLSLFPLQPGTQHCSLSGILPVCLCVHTSIVARQLPGEGCWKPGQSPQVGLALGSGMWSLHTIWESPIDIARYVKAC